MHKSLTTYRKKRDFEITIGDHGLCDRQSVEVAANEMDALNHGEVGVCLPVGEQEVWLHPCGIDRVAIACVANGAAPFTGKILTTFEARCVVEQEVGVAEVSQRDVPVRIVELHGAAGAGGRTDGDVIDEEAHCTDRRVGQLQRDLIKG